MTVDTFLHDLRLALRRLTKEWRFSASVIAILALGIGSSVAVFSLVDAIVLRSLPFDDADRLVRIFSTNPGRNVQFFSTSAPDFLDWQERAQTLDVAAMEARSENLSGDGEPVRAMVAAVTYGFGPLLGLQTPWGRWFTPEEDQPNGPRVAVLSHELARDRFGSPDAALGHVIDLDGIRRQIVGVAAPGFGFPSQADLWRPLQLQYVAPNRDNRDLEVIGKVREGSTLGEAQAELEALAATSARDNADKNEGWSARADAFRGWLVPETVSSGLNMVFGAVLLVLLIACFNVAGLLVARAGRRQSEFVVQAALGASRRRLLAGAVSESLVLAVAGAGIGAVFADWAVAIAAARAGDALPLADLARVDARALAFAAGLAVMVALLTGLAPAWRSVRTSLADSLREGGRSASAGRSTQRFRRGLAVAQLAVSLALLVGAGLLIQSLRRLERAPLGFDASNVLTASVVTPRNAYPSQEAWTGLYRETLERLRNAPGVRAAAMSSGLPLSENNTGIDISSPQSSTLPAGQTLQTYWRIVSPGYFETLGIPLLEGEEFHDATPGEGAPQVILSRAAARFLWPAESAVGKQIRIGSDGGVLQVVGVADDVRQRQLEAFAGPGIYVHYAYWAWGVASFAVRTESEPEGATPLLREALAAKDPGLPLFDVEPMSALVARAAGQARFQSILLTAFAAVAALLAAIGLYGVLSFMIEQRRRELALRLAFGALWSDIRGLVLGAAARLWLAGAAIGLVLAWTLSRLIRSSLYEVDPADPLVYLGVTALLALVALAAAWFPARRASQVDPATALRYD